MTVASAYCAPFVLASGCALQDTINNFILVGESNTRINDIGTGCAANNYDNRIGQSVTLMTSMTYTAFVSTQFSSNEYLGIWIDFDDDFVFEASEQVGARLLNSTLNTPVTMTMPAAGGSVVGTHRMRVTVLYAYPANPCGPPATYGETHDYTVNIIAYTRELFTDEMEKAV